MLAEIDSTVRIFLSCGHTDMRKSIDGLASMVTQNFNLDPFNRSLFLFCGRRRDRIKGLLWEGDGFLLLYKRLEAGSFTWPKDETEVIELNSQQYRWLMEGLSIHQKKTIQKLDNRRIL